MLENLKVDIIYYRTTKDFEMEFNLCGCCRMRLLNSIANDIKSLINCLKLAVARSKVILLCGEIYGEKNLFDIISKAICRETEEIDNSIYGIATPGSTRLMKNSIPLISKSGVLCGCVVEEGPQSIIILSNNKEERKEIMNTLVHQYISELSAIQHIEVSENIDAQEINSNEDAESEIIEENDAVQSETIPEEEIQSSDIDSNEDISANESIDSDLHFVLEEKEYSKNTSNYDLDDFSLLHTTNDSMPNQRQPRSHSKHSKPSSTSPVLTILICLLVCFIGILLYFLILKPLQSGISISENFFKLIPFLSRRFL